MAYGDDMAKPQSSTLRILAVERTCLTLSAGSRSWIEPWRAISLVLLAQVEWGEGIALAAAITFDTGARTHTVVLTEAHPEWTVFMVTAQSTLPGFVRRQDWQRRIAKAAQGVVVYERDAYPSLALN